ncbi:YbhB/YbcL family Raf kinase inhibitor-like protein [soil metagenome]
MKTISSLLFIAASATAAFAGPFKLASNDFKAHGAIADKHVFNSFGCSGGNVSPELHWTDAPKDTKSFALMVHDPDAPTGSGWWHWVIYNIPADSTSIPTGGPAPKGASEQNTDFGKPGYGGPCPPEGSGKHHYNFTLFALKVDHLDIPKDATAAFVGFNVNGNMLAKTTLTGLYERKKAPAVVPAKK